jgi:serine/threonine protein phosphatase 1
MPNLDTARTPDGLRLYAIGDIHGRLDLLREMHARIAADLAARPCARHRIIHLGDYIDRGPDSAGVVEHLICALETGESVCLAGNHDLYVPAFLKDPSGVGEHWMRYGGMAALRSWGVDPDSPALMTRPWRVLRDAFAAALPESHRSFFANLSFMEQHGDYVFVHAGVRPGVPLRKQRVADLTMIREPFLSHEGDLGAIIVHGHTVVAEPEMRPNRIGLDTRAYGTGILSCAVLEGEAKGLLLPGGYRAVPVTFH